jgi:hypothetical protein
MPWNNIKLPQKVLQGETKFCPSTTLGCPKEQTKFAPRQDLIVSSLNLETP